MNLLPISLNITIWNNGSLDIYLFKTREQLQNLKLFWDIQYPF